MTDQEEIKQEPANAEGPADQTPQQPQHDGDVAGLARRRRYDLLVEKFNKGDNLSRNEIKELEELKIFLGKTNLVSTDRDLARILKVHPRTVRKWKNRDDFPKLTPQGFYDVDLIKAWREDMVRSRQKPDADTIDWDKEYRRIKYKSELLKYQKQCGELLDKKIVEQYVADVIMVTKRNLLSLPSKIALRLVGLEAWEIKTLLHEEIASICDQFAKGLEGKYCAGKGTEEGQEDMVEDESGSVADPGGSDSESVGGPASSTPGEDERGAGDVEDSTDAVS